MRNSKQRWRKLNSGKNRSSRGFCSDDRGFSLFTVMIAVSFIGILGMLLLYIALANFQMKTTNLRGKDSFYTAERALEEIRIGLQEDVGNAMSKAYLTTMETYDENTQELSGEASLDELRQSSFRELFIKELAKVLQGTAEDENGYQGEEYYSMKKLRGYVDLDDSADFDDSSESLVITNPSGSQPRMEKSVSGGVLLKNLKVIYVDEKGRASVIETDIRLGVPKTQYPTPSTLPDLMNMIVVADGGIICEGGAGSNSIQGSIYAGNIDKNDIDLTQKSILTDTSILLKENASLSVSNGDKLVCEGEIRVSNRGTFNCAREVTLWAQGVTLASANVSLLGKTYLADDVTVEAGTGSNVKISGEYYGYGSPTSAKDSKNSTKFDQWTDTALSSAIVVNGKNTTLDLSGVTKMMLAGRSYVGSTKVNGIPINGATSIRNDDNDIMTGESITVKGAQVAYLLPAKLLKAQDSGSTDSDTELHNPMDYNEYLTKLAEAEQNGGLSAILNMNTPVEEWGGKTLSQIGVDSAKPVTKVFFNNQSDNGYVYFYLNFTDPQKASAFMTEYYQNNPVVKENMDKYLSFYFPQNNNGIKINDTDSMLRYVTNGNVLTYDGETEKGELRTATDTTASSELTQEQINYQNMWYTLNRKMIGSYDLLKTKVTDSDGVTHDETKSDRSVYDNLVNVKELVRFIQSHTTGLRYGFDAGADNDNLTAILYHNGESVSYQESSEDTDIETVTGDNTELEITMDMADRLRLVVCTGDVRIKSNVHFQGIIMAKGKITLEDGASLTSAPLEAAKVFQALNSQVSDSSKALFWEGDRYVLGNTTATEDTTSGKISDTYDISQSIVYENWKKR